MESCMSNTTKNSVKQKQTLLDNAKTLVNTPGLNCKIKGDREVNNWTEFF